MRVALGIVSIVLGVVGWVGQAVSAISFSLAQRLGLQEEAETDPLYSRAELNAARWDTVVLWTLVLAGLWMLTDSPWWPQVSLIAGGIYVDAGGREAAKYASLQGGGVRVGTPKAQKLAVGTYVSLVVVGLWNIAYALRVFATGT